MGPGPPTVARRPPVTAPLSYFQEDYWRREQLGVPTHASIVRAHRVRGECDLAALERSLNAIVGRHEALRTTFRRMGATPRQIVAPRLVLPVHLVPLNARSRKRREAAVQAWIAREAARAFALDEAPLIRVTALRLAPLEHVLLVTVHHIVCDAWSIGVLESELSDLYAAAVSGAPDPLPAMQAQHRDYVSWQRRRVATRLEAGLSYWAGQLRRLPSELPLPTRRSRAEVDGYRHARHCTVIDPDTVEGISALARRCGTTRYTTLLAAWLALLHMYSGEDDIVVASLFDGRQEPVFEPLIGLFANLTALRVPLRAEMTVEELVLGTQTVLLEAHEHQDVPLTRVARVVEREARSSQLPIWDVWFNAVPEPAGELTLTGASVTPVPLPERNYTKGPEVWTGDNLTLTVSGRRSVLEAAFTYNANLFDAVVIAGMALAYQRVLERVVADPNVSLATLARAVAAVT